MLQISSGQLKGLPLTSPSGQQTRPSGERLRQALFNRLRTNPFTLPQNPAEWITCDLFAGAGTFTAEAISHGVQTIHCVENHPLALKCLTENFKKILESLKSQSIDSPNIYLHKNDVTKFYKFLPPAHLIFSDPPYEKGYFQKLISLEDEHSKLMENGLFIFESELSEQIPTSSTLKCIDSKIYGDSVLHFFVKQD